MSHIASARTREMKNDRKMCIQVTALTVDTKPGNRYRAFNKKQSARRTHTGHHRKNGIGKTPATSEDDNPFGATGAGPDTPTWGVIGCQTQTLGVGAGSAVRPGRPGKGWGLLSDTDARGRGGVCCQTRTPGDGAGSAVRPGRSGTERCPGRGGRPTAGPQNGKTRPQWNTSRARCESGRRVPTNTQSSAPC